jgi:peroxiredoxin
MRIPVALVALLAVAAGACAAPQANTEQTAVTAASTTTVQAAATQSSQTRFPPRGMVAVSRRQRAPTLRVTAFDGRTVTVDQFRGRPLVVSFFESWCPICQVEQPDLSQVASRLSGRVGFVGVSYHDTVAAGRAYQRRFKVPYPLANDPSGRTWAHWRVPYQPVTVLVDKQGRIAERFDGGTTGGTLRVHLDYLLDE